MPIFHPSIFYVHLRTWATVFWRTLKNPSWKRWLFMGVFGIAFSVTIILFSVLRLLDEIFFFGYRRTKIEKPIFIIANPRSGTTYMHRLMCLDKEKFSYTLLYHTIAPSILFYKFVKLVGLIDRPLGRPIRRTIDRVDAWLFDRWKHIHPMGLNKSEEDEGTFMLTGLSTGMYFFTPYAGDLEHIRYSDALPERSRRAMKKFYKNTLQRFMYSEGKGRIFLSKNVSTTGRLKSLMEIFPDARIIFLVRNPMNAVPSFVSMFSAPWKFHSPELADDSEYHRQLGETAMGYYNYFQEVKDIIPERQLMTLRYDDLVDDPKSTVLQVYEQFDLEVTDELRGNLDNLKKRNRNYKSKHSYTIEQYGFSESEIYEELEEVFKTHNFTRPDVSGVI